MKKSLAIAGIAACCLSAPVFADGLENAKKSGCMDCHTVSEKKVGPAFKDVAAKYKGDSEAEAKLIKKTKEGGSGVWGKMPMPKQASRISDAELKETIGWILGL